VSVAIIALTMALLGGVGMDCDCAANQDVRRQSCFIALLMAVAVLLAAQPSMAQDADGINREHAIKAAYLYQFSRYVQWPTSTQDGEATPFVIGVLGDSPVADILNQIAQSKKIEGRTIVVKHFSSVSECTPCHILFIAASLDTTQQDKAIERFERAGVLLVGEETGFTRRGGMANFTVNENRVLIEINLEKSKQAGLEISSKLLSLAKVVVNR
jgi:hypothetical protein